ncbi:MAG TPA: amidohydrolase family protein [Phycisphaeraceae bacterium]
MNQACPAIDVAAWVGQYPFRGILHSSLTHLLDKLAALQVERAVVSPFEALFWENNLDAFDLWSHRLAEHSRLELWPVVNPAMPGQIARLARRLDEHAAHGQAVPRGLRLLPNYHGYRLDAPAVDDLMRLARERSLIVQVFQRIADERWHWMLSVPPVPPEDLLAFVDRHDQQPILISALNAPQLLADRLRSHPALYADLSRLRGPLFALERLLEQAPADRLVFGSLWPIQIIEATLWQITYAQASDATKADLLRGNAARLLQSASDQPRTATQTQATSPSAGPLPSRCSE